ncbi:hypothetical protein L4C33_22090, partial [Vibrio makurazakiensis]|uniref:hypothetical protein n=1 Tax=Vibrio makurazakiensis TaxID=2910250 RepID=UPI003D11E047
STKSLFINSPLIGHLDKEPHLNYRYFQGGFRALKKNFMGSPWNAYFCIRKSLVGVYYVIRYKMPIRKFFGA